MSFSVNCAVPAKKIVVIGAGLAGLVASYIKASNIIRC